MAPTVHHNQKNDRSRSSEKRSDLLARVKFCNTLPDIPFDPKALAYPFDTTRFVQYNPTSLERNHKFDLLTEHDLGVEIDLINTEAYNLDPNIKLNQKDEPLLEDEIGTTADSKRSLSHRKNVSWLRKTEYISTEYNRFVPSAQKAETRVGFTINQKITDEILYKDRESQMKAINSTFQAANVPITQHYSKPNVVPVEIMPVYPDFEMWKHPCAQVIFDSDPAPSGKSSTAQVEDMSQAIICGEEYVIYFLPTQETLEKRRRDASTGIDYEPEDEYDYVLAREYNWTVKNKSSRDYVENYFFVFRNGGAYYNELETRVRLSKKRKVGQAGSVPKKRLVVKHRPLTSQEVAAQDARASILEPLGDEDEELDYHQKFQNESINQEEKEDKEADSEETGNKNQEREEEENDEREEKGEEREEEEEEEGGREKDENEKKGNDSEGSEEEEEDEEGARNKEKEEIFGSESSDSD